MLGALPPEHCGEARGRRRLERAVQRLHATLREHPGVAQIVASRRTPIPALDRFRETLLSIFDDAGFPIEVAVQAVSALASYAAGFANVERHRAQVSPADEAARLRALPHDAFPRLHDGAASYAGHISQDAFTLGLRSFIGGLPDAARRSRRALLAGRLSAWSTRRRPPPDSR